MVAKNGESTSFDAKIEGYSGKKFIKWSKDDIKTQGIDSNILDNEEYFVIVFDTTTYKTVDVIYSAGRTYDGSTYYTLTDMEDVIN